MFSLRRFFSLYSSMLINILVSFDTRFERIEIIIGLE